MLQQLYDRSPVALQTFMLNVKAAELHFERYGRKYSRAERLFARSESMSADEMRAWQNGRLAKLIEHAWNHSNFHRSRMQEAGIQPGDVRCVEDLAKFPEMTKDDVRTCAKDILVNKRARGVLRKGSTSGTTGTPLSMYYDIGTCVMHHVVDWRQKQIGGLYRGKAFGSLQGRAIVPPFVQNPPFWRRNYLLNQTFYSALHLSKANIGFYVDHIRSNGLRYLEGYPSTLAIIANYLVNSGDRLQLDAVFTSSETLYEGQRALLESAFGCEVFDSYGMAERVCFATECEAHSGKHLNEDYGITEFVGEGGAAANVGSLGRIVATSLHNFAFPMIRYRTNDVGSQMAGDCGCGRKFPRMAPITTKREAILTLPDGRLMSPSALTHPFKPMHRIAASQIIQTAPDKIEVRIVRRPDYGVEDETLLRKGLTERLGGSVQISISHVDSVEPSDGSKFRWVVSNVPSPIDNY